MIFFIIILEDGSLHIKSPADFGFGKGQFSNCWYILADLILEEGRCEEPFLVPFRRTLISFVRVARHGLLTYSRPHLTPTCSGLSFNVRVDTKFRPLNLEARQHWPVAIQWIKFNTVQLVREADKTTLTDISPSWVPQMPILTGTRWQTCPVETPQQHIWPHFHKVRRKSFL